MSEMREANTLPRIREKLLALLARQTRREADNPRRQKTVVRQAWDGHPDHGGTMYVEVPPGVWVEAQSDHYELFDVRLDPDACDPDPHDLGLCPCPTCVRQSRAREESA